MSNIYRVEVACRDAALDSEGREALHGFREYGLDGVKLVRLVRVYTIAGEFSARDADRVAREFLTDPVVEMFAINMDVLPARGPENTPVEISRRAGVMDPAEASVRKGMAELGCAAEWVRTAKKYIVSGSVRQATLKTAALRILANDVIEQVVVGRSPKAKAPEAEAYSFEKTVVPLEGLDEAALLQLSKAGQLHLSAAELRAVQAYFRKLGRNPTDIELETVAQTWSEHCVHKTFRGKIRYREAGKPDELIDNLLKCTVARATRELNKEWCWSVFEDNAGVIDFDGETGAVFKVETHNHPSAIEPYGGAGTGVGGVIRDPLGTGLGAKPVLNTDVFCFGPPDLPRTEVPKGALHPMRVLKGVVAGVRDYGNRMGIPTANGAIYFDKRYTGNPLVFCGNVALVPKSMAKKRRPAPGMLGVVVGGRTGRDGIHGATFSSVELDETSETVSSGAVQIGNPIEEKKVLDFLLRARDLGLYECVTDCGAGGLSSALGELGEKCGVEVELDRVPLKYAGLSYTEIWISEAQERMVIGVKPEKLEELRRLAAEENVEITAVAKFTDDRKLRLRYAGETVGELDMEFLHDGVPQVEREAVWAAPALKEAAPEEKESYGDELRAILSAWNVCSKEWVIRQYDHEVQAGSVLKPLVGATHDGPGDAAVIAPVLGSRRALVVACGMNPRYSDLDPYWMAAGAIDEALRNVIAVGGSLERCAILDNFCWGNTEKPDRLGGLVRAAKACYDFATAYGVPFISGKDSLNNEFGTGEGTICIPGSLLISALAVLDDLGRAVSMDLKRAGNFVYCVGLTRNELGGSHYLALRGETGRAVPKVDAALGKKIFAAMSKATAAGLLRAAHDLSEGGLAVAAAEMAFAGGLGLELTLDEVPAEGELPTAALMFSESNSRFLVEVEPEKAAEFERLAASAGAPAAKVGLATAAGKLRISRKGKTVIDEGIEVLKLAWQTPLAL